MPNQRVSMFRLLIYHVVVISIAGGSLYLCYGPLSSIPWKQEYNCVKYVRVASKEKIGSISSDAPCEKEAWKEIEGNTAKIEITYYKATGWLLELLRAIGLAILSIISCFVLHREAVAWWESKKRTFWFQKLKTWERWLSIGAVVSVVVYHPISAFMLHQRYAQEGSKFLHDALIPYLSYLPYTCACYLLLLLPATILLFRNLRNDFYYSKMYTQELRKLRDGMGDLDGSELSAMFIRYLCDFEEYAEHRAREARRSLAFASILVVYLVYELMTTTYLTLVYLAQEALKSIVLLLVIASFVDVWRLVRKYQAQRVEVGETLDLLQLRARECHDMELEEKVQRKKVEIRKKSTVTYLFRIGREGGFLSLLLQVGAPVLVLVVETRNFLKFVDFIVPDWLSKPILMLIDILTQKM